jgi:hypothetical protein
MTTTTAPKPSAEAMTCPTWCDTTHGMPLLEGFDPCHFAHVLDVELGDGLAVVTVEKTGDAPASIWVEVPGALTPQDALTVANAMRRAAGIAQGS